MWLLKKILKTSAGFLKDAYDVVLLDMNSTSSINTGNEGLFWLKEIRKIKI